MLYNRKIRVVSLRNNPYLFIMFNCIQKMNHTFYLNQTNLGVKWEMLLIGRVGAEMSFLTVS
jgi:hypothetical protein